MGRWAQQHRRGASGRTPPTQTQASLGNVHENGAGSVTLAFDHPITAANFALSDFKINTGAGFLFPTSITQFAATTLQADQAGWGVTDDAPWQLIHAPSYVTFPASGTVDF